MAQIPTWQPSVTKQAGSMQPVTAPMSDMGAPVFAGIKENIQAAQQYQQKQDTYDVTNAYNDAMNKVQSSFYGDNGIFTLKGANALGAKATDTTPEVPDVINQAQSSLAQIRDNAFKNLNPRQQEMFSKAFYETYNTYQQTAYKYQQKQQQVADKDTYDSTYNTSYNGFATSMLMVSQETDPNLKEQFQQNANQNLRDIIANETLYGKKIGLTDAVIKDNINKRMNSSIKNVVFNLLDNGDVDGANKAVEYFGDKLDANTFADIDGKLRPANIKVNSQKISDSLVGEFGLNEASGIRALKERYGNDPNLDTYIKKYTSDITVYSVAQNRQRGNLRDSIANQVVSCGSDVSRMHDIIAGSGLDPKDQFTLIKTYVTPVENKLKALNKPQRGKYSGYTDSDKQMLQYQERGYTKDWERYEKLKNKDTDDAGGLNDAEKAEYDQLGTRINNFWSWQRHFYNLGGNQSQGEQPQDNSSSEGVRNWYAAFYRLKDNGLTDEEAEAGANRLAQGGY